MKRNSVIAFKWIVGVLRGSSIPFQVSGGFAARLYGSDRPLFDIDIEVQDRYFDKLVPLVKDKIIFGPERDADENLDVLVMTLEYQGQKIDISGCESDLLFNLVTKQWESCNTRIDDVVEMKVYGLKVPVIRWQDLVEYKRRIGRPTDLEDIKAISKRQSK
jgi:hypothetical protein